MKKIRVKSAGYVNGHAIVILETDTEEFILDNVVELTFYASTTCFSELNLKLALFEKKNE